MAIPEGEGMGRQQMADGLSGSVFVFIHKEMDIDVYPIIII